MLAARRDEGDVVAQAPRLGRFADVPERVGIAERERRAGSRRPQAREGERPLHAEQHHLPADLDDVPGAGAALVHRLAGHDERALAHVLQRDAAVGVAAQDELRPREVRRLEGRRHGGLAGALPHEPCALVPSVGVLAASEDERLPRARRRQEHDLAHARRLVGRPHDDQRLQRRRPVGLGSSEAHALEGGRVVGHPAVLATI